MVKKSDDNKQLKEHFSALMSGLFDASGDKGYKKFLLFLILLDLFGFVTIATDNFFGWNLIVYNEFAWIFLFALILMILSNVKRINKIPTQGFRSESFASLATLVVGVMALVTAILSLPSLNLTAPILKSIKGIIALIAIVYIVLEAWVIKKH